MAHAELALARDDTGQAAMALGAADGLRARAGLRVWPIARRTERDLVAAVSQRMDPAAYRLAFDAGAALSMRDALVLIGGDEPAPTTHGAV